MRGDSAPEDHCFRSQVFSKYVRRYLSYFGCKKPSLPIREQEARAKIEIEKREKGRMNFLEQAITESTWAVVAMETV